MPRATRWEPVRPAPTVFDYPAGMTADGLGFYTLGEVVAYNGTGERESCFAFLADVEQLRQEMRQAWAELRGGRHA